MTGVAQTLGRIGEIHPTLTTYGREFSDCVAKSIQEIASELVRMAASLMGVGVLFRQALNYVAVVIALGATVAPTGRAGADNELGVVPGSSFISEIRGGILYHEDSRLRRLLFNQSKPREDGLIDINAEILFWRPQWHFDNPIVNFALTPRLRAGTSINTGRGTSQASIGLAWDYYLTSDIFVEASFDIAIHNGHTGRIPEVGHRPLGCNPLFRQSFTVGKDITERWRLMLTIEHLDNFELCDQNAGLSNLGVRLGYRF